MKQNQKDAILAAIQEIRIKWGALPGPVPLDKPLKPQRGTYGGRETYTPVWQIQYYGTYGMPK